MARALLVLAVLLLTPGPDLAAQGGGQGGPGGQRPRPQMPARAGGPQRAEDLPKGTSIIRGQVVAADTGAPVRRAQVRAFTSTGGGRDSRVALTDAQGRFELKDLPAGRYSVQASKGGYVGLQYGQRRPGESGTPLELADKQVLDKVLIALPRGSVISGRISDEFGEPIANAVVSAFRYGFVGGVRRLVPASGGNSRATTDDRGEYRLFGLPPGEYVVAANMRLGGADISDQDADVTGFAPTYFPGTSNSSEAQRVNVGLGAEQNGVSFGLIATRLVRVSGTVTSSQGMPVEQGVVMMFPAGTGPGTGMLIQAGGGRIDRGGTFRIPNVAPGRYVLQVRMFAQSMEFTRQEISVGTEDIEGIAIVTQPAARISGQVVTDTGQPLSISTSQVMVSARSVDPDMAGMPGPGGGGGNTRPGDDWRFELSGITDPRVFRATAPDGWMLKAVTLNGQDITDTPLDLAPGSVTAGLEVVLTQKATGLSGMIGDDAGKAVLDATVVVFPADEKLWTYQSRFIRAARPDQDGRYLLKGLPPHDAYLAVALQGLEDGQAGDPDFLARVRESATRFSLGDAETKALDLKLSTVR